ncbi:MAG: hypothetical protein WAV90_17185 [Gordonia amarae]
MVSRSSGSASDRQEHIASMLRRAQEHEAQAKLAEAQKTCSDDISADVYRNMAAADRRYATLLGLPPLSDEPAPGIYEVPRPAPGGHNPVFCWMPDPGGIRGWALLGPSAWYIINCTCPGEFVIVKHRDDRFSRREIIAYASWSREIVYAL